MCAVGSECNKIMEHKTRSFRQKSLIQYTHKGTDNLHNNAYGIICTHT
jgi:hypothetical protein